MTHSLHSPRALSPRPRPLTRLFTLIELLVVIAIISVLVAMLLPALGRAKQQAKYGRWLGHRAHVRVDDDVEVYYTFEEESGSKDLYNESAGMNIEPYHAERRDLRIFGGGGIDHQNGRWPGKGSLVFFSNNYADNTAKTFTWKKATLDNPEPVTVMFWQFRYNTVSNQSVAFTFQNNAPATDNVRFKVGTHLGNMYWDYGNAYAGPGRIDIPYTQYNNIWTHVALVSEGKNGSLLAIYINGQLAAQENASDAPSMDMGQLSLGKWDRYSYYFGGVLDEFVIYNRVLRPDEIRAHFENGAP